MNIKKQIATLLAAACVIPLAAHAAPIITFVGTDGNQTQFRTTTVVKAFDADGNNVYGTDGYVGYAMDIPPANTNNGTVDTNPLTYTSTNYATRRSDPSYATLSTNGQNRVAFGFTGTSYPLVDDPAAAPGASVIDIKSGFAIRFGITTVGGVTTGNMLNITFGSTAPATGVRIGVIINDDETNGVGVDRVTLGGVTHESPNTGGAFTFKFFDVRNITGGDVITLALSKDADNATPGQVAYYGVTFDTLPVPEPTTLAMVLGGFGMLVGFQRARRRAQS